MTTSKRFNEFLLLLLTLIYSVSTSELLGINLIEKNSTYAVVVGISDYQDPQISDLSYPIRDAEIFVQYLKSPAGGNVESDHIISLFNERATAGRFAAALDWMMRNLREGDQAIIYFAGHADLEHKTLNQPGFLLCWDSPERVYMGGGTFGLAYLKDVISIMSDQLKANVLLISDLYSISKPGKNEMETNRFIAQYLKDPFAHEIKIINFNTSADSDKDYKLDSGNSFFSQYLIKGLAGFADQNNNGFISLNDIQSYLTKASSKLIPSDTHLIEFAGDKNFVLSKVNISFFKEVQKNDVLGLFTEKYFNNDDIISSNTSFKTKDSALIRKFYMFNKAFITGHLIYPEENSAWSLYQDLKDNSFFKSELNAIQSNFAAVLQDEAQQAINDYLKSDPNELKKRWNYDDRYEKFPVYLSKAAELLGENHILYKSIKAREHYFKGLNIRLHGERNKDTALYRQAINEQYITIELDSNAAYSYNELGILGRRFKNYPLAINYFNQAISHSPDWVLPWANLTSCYINTHDFQMAIQTGLKAVEIDPKSFLTQYNLANAYQDNLNWKDAEAHYRISLQLDSTDKDALLNLSQMLYQQKDYPQAEIYTLKCIKLYPDFARVNMPLTFLYLKQGKKDKALEALEKLLQSGFKEIESLEQDPDFKELMDEPGYLALKKKYFYK